MTQRYESLGHDLSPSQRGALTAHQICAGPTKAIQRSLRSARRRRRNPIVWLWPGRRRYLQALIEGLEKELDARGRSDE